jgi:hypothetical protein
VGDAEPKTPYVITIRERATSRIGTLRNTTTARILLIGINVVQRAQNVR